MIKINQGSSYKVGVNEVVGLLDAMKEAMSPVQAWLKDLTYWTDCELTESEYKSRDGFHAYSHNCGGIELSEIIPECESYQFDFLDFGECSECKVDSQCGHNGMECASAGEGHLDAKIRVWLKFEGIKDDSMTFYLYLGGGNGDAPYFRTKYEATVFETTFTARSIAEFKMRAKHAIREMLLKVGSK